jgi:23S rRNA (guanosine2251-2'-O)-methyltransferase
MTDPRRAKPEWRRRGKAKLAPRQQRTQRQPDGAVEIYGIHAVEAALGNHDRRVKGLYITENAERRLRPHLEERQIAFERTTPRDLDRRLGADTVHQGALMETALLPEPSLKQLIAASENRPLLMLDQVTDPHNVGAVLRSAAVFGAAGLVMTRRHSPPLDGALAKAASGALEHVPVYLAQNLARTMADLKDGGMTVIGLDGEADDLLEEASQSAHVALVLGSEGKGLRQLTRESCSLVARIGTEGALTSLNVSNAAAIALHWMAARRLGLVRR